MNKKNVSYHQHLLAFSVFVVPVRRLSADAFELLLDDGFQHWISRTWTSYRVMFLLVYYSSTKKKKNPLQNKKFTYVSPNC